MINSHLKKSTVCAAVACLTGYGVASVAATPQPSHPTLAAVAIVPAVHPAVTPFVVPPVTPVAVPVVDITRYGAVCDGIYDNAPAIASAAAAAKAQKLSLFIPQGVCAYNGVIRLDGVKLKGTGDASVLYALNWAQESIFLFGNGPEVRSVKLSGVRAPARQSAWETTRIAVFGATNFVVDHVTIAGSAATGVQTALAASYGHITNNHVMDTLADAIHMTDRSSHITVAGNLIERAGDDGIAVVSYRHDGGLVHNIAARNNIIRDNKFGRLMSVVGGDTVLYENNLLDTNLSPYACLYIAQESSWGTYGAHNVTARYNTMKDCGSVVTGHAAITLYSDGQEANTNIKLIRNDVVQQGAAGVRVFTPMNTAVVVDSNRITGSKVALEITTPGVTVVAYVSGAAGEVGL